MLHLAKIFCLILVATATSISAEDAILSAVENFNAAVRLSTQLINSKDYLAMQILMDLNGTAPFRLQQMAQEGRLSHDEVREIRTLYEKLDEEIRQLLSKAKTEAVQSFVNSKEEVKTYVSMYSDHRIGAVQAAKLIIEMSRKEALSQFIAQIHGRPVVVKLNSGVDYRGVLACLDGYMNIALEQTEEYVNGQLKDKYGDAFIRGNNVLYISTQKRKT